MNRQSLQMEWTVNLNICFLISSCHGLMPLALRLAPVPVDWHWSPNSSSTCHLPLAYNILKTHTISDYNQGLFVKRNLKNLYLYQDAISYAARQGHIECINLLLKTGPDVNGNKCRNPLREAAREGRKEALQSLIDKGADVNMPHGTDTALLATVTNDHYECVDMLLKAGANVNTVFHAVLFERNSSNPCIDQKLQAGADVNVTNSWVFTALIEASRFNVSRMKTVIKAGTDVNMINIRSDSINA